MKRVQTLICAVTLFTGCCGNGDKTEMDIDRQVDRLYERMCNEERIAQLRSGYMDPLFSGNGKLDTAAFAKLYPYGIGHFSQYASQGQLDANTLRDRVAAIQDYLMKNTPNGIPALFHEEALSGINTMEATIYPQQIGQACSFNPVLAELKTKQTATGLRKLGGILALSPMVDVCRNPGFNRLEESYGEDAYLSAVMGTAFVKGLQSGSLKTGVGACSKHYLGYGGGGDASEKELMEEILFPHEAMIRLAGSKVVMPGYHSVHGINCVANKEILIDILRNYIGFDGMVVSDYNAIDQIPGLDDIAEKAAAAISGGNDVDFPHGVNYARLQEALDRGLVTDGEFERAVKAVLKHKFRAGLFDKNPYLYSTEDLHLDSADDRQTAYDIAVQSVVLLENNGILPLEDVKNIFVTGPNANSIWAMCGDYSFPAMSYFWQKNENPGHPYIAKLLDGMKNRKPEGFCISYSRGCDWTEEIETIYSEVGDERAWEYGLLHRKVNSEEKADKEEALKMARESDVIIAAVGENVMLCGENRDRRGLRLPGKQEEYVEALLATGKPVVLVVFGGRAQVISRIAGRCAAVIQAWYPGEEGGNAVADILYGKVSPSAKLSVSYPAEEIYDNLCYNYAACKDARVEWPFGYGLSYSSFEYSNFQIDNEAATSDESIVLSFDLSNTGNMKADEIAQIYISPTSPAQNIRPIQLQGFSRVSLEPDETKTVRVRLYIEQFGYYSNNGTRCWNIDPGCFEVRVAASSADTRLRGTVTLTGQKTTKPLREFYFSEVL